MPANAPTFRRPEPWSPVLTDGPAKRPCFGDLHRAGLQVGVPNFDGRALAPRHEFVERWEDRKLRLAAERAGIVVVREPPKAVGGRKMRVPPSVRRQVRKDWSRYSLTSIARHHGLSSVQIERITRDMGAKPRCSAERAAAPAGKRPARRPSGSGSSRRANGRARRGERRAVSRGLKVKGRRTAGRRKG